MCTILWCFVLFFVVISWTYDRPTLLGLKAVDTIKNLNLNDSCHLFSWYSSGLRHWHWGNPRIAPLSVKQPWNIWVKSTCTKPQQNTKHMHNSWDVLSTNYLLKTSWIVNNDIPASNKFNTLNNIVTFHQLINKSICVIFNSKTII